MTRKFYKTTYTLEVLSEEPINPNVSLEDLHYMITDGDCSGVVHMDNSEEVDGKTMAELLMKQQSDPGFFMLNENGDDVE